METAPSVRAWSPEVTGVAEVLHAHFPNHAYPSHTHDTWTVLLVDSGTVLYELGRNEHATRRRSVTLLPPHVPHDGRGATPDGFRKRVVYLEEQTLDVGRVGRAVDQPVCVDRELLREVQLLHEALRHPGDELEAAGCLALVVELLGRHLGGDESPAVPLADTALAARLRELLDAHVVSGITLADAAGVLDAHPAALVRAFRRELGISPHRYLTGRRIDSARRLLLAGQAPADVAAEVGFHDQSHLTRHFKRVLGVTPGAFSRASA